MRPASLAAAATRAALLAACALVLGCSTSMPSTASSSDASSGPDLGAVDMLVAQTACASQPASDGQACGGGCAAGSTCAGYSAAELRCYATCDLAAPSCACGRRCVAINGAQGGAACLPANGAGERCGASAGGQAYGHGACAQGLVCAGPTDTRYCVPTCTTSTSCAPQTSCKDVVDNLMVSNSVCWFNSSTTGKAVGESCDLQTFCAPNALCAGGACRQQCGGPADSACLSGSCTALGDGERIFAYVCM